MCSSRFVVGVRPLAIAYRCAHSLLALIGHYSWASEMGRQAAKIVWEELRNPLKELLHWLKVGGHPVELPLQRSRRYRDRLWTAAMEVVGTTIDATTMKIHRPLAMRVKTI